MAFLGFCRVSIGCEAGPMEWYLHQWQMQGCFCKLNFTCSQITATTICVVDHFIGLLSVHVIIWEELSALAVHTLDYFVGWAYPRPVLDSHIFRYVDILYGYGVHKDLLWAPGWIINPV